MSSRPHAKALYRAGLAVLCAVVLAGFCLRVQSVNATAVHVPEEHYAQGEWLDQDSCFLDDKTEEAPAASYSYRIERVEVMTPNEYLTRYAKDGTTSIQEEYAEENTVLAVTMTIQNNGSENGGVAAWDWHIVPASNVDDYIADGALFAHVQPEVGEELQFSIKPGSSYTATFPFYGQTNPRYFEPDTLTHRPVITGTSFRLVMTNLPTRKVFDLSVG